MTQPSPEPFRRFRWRRCDEATRAQFRETTLRAEDFIWPVFLVDGCARSEPIAAMPGVARMSCDALIEALAQPVAHGLRAVLLFGVPDAKGVAQAYAGDGIVQRAIPAIKRVFPALELITDVCLCSYTHDGHCHIGDNDETCALLARMAVSHARAGADAVAPSDMMDGRVWYIRAALHAAQAAHTRIISYAAKFASAYYGPFRDAAQCAPRAGDRATYQLDPANGCEALDEIAADLDEGATAIIIKPALAYLDIIARARNRFTCPLIAYNVSAEYVMLQNAVRDGVAARTIIDETLLSIKRAGADRIISYFTPTLLARL